MKPRVHWVSPLPPAQTDIAHYTRRILPELAKATDLTLWTDAAEWDYELYDFCSVRQLDPDRVLPRDFASVNAQEHALGGGPEAVFVNIGNAWPFHAGLLRLVQRIPAVIVLHDVAIQELCLDGIARGLFPRKTYEDNMLQFYGAEGLKAAQEGLEGGRDREALSQRFPGFELALPRAVSVVSHTAVAHDAVREAGTVPSYLLDLPFRPSMPKPDIIRSGIGPMRLVQFGYTGPNRRLQKVLEALAPLKDKIDFRLDVMGHIWDPDYIRQRADELGLSRHVHLHGFVEEDELDRKLAKAHLVFNLRYPTMGEASGSQMRIWNAAAPSVVTDLGWYADLPDDTVFKIDQAEEIPALQSLLRKLAADPRLARKVGAAGRAQLEARHTPARYAEKIAQVATRFQQDAATSIRARRARSFEDLREPSTTLSTA